MAVYTLLFLAVYVLAPIAILLVFLFWQPRHALWSIGGTFSIMRAGAWDCCS